MKRRVLVTSASSARARATGRRTAPPRAVSRCAWPYPASKTQRGVLAMSAPLASPLVAGSAALLYGGTGVALAFINKAVISVYGFQVC